MRVPDGWGRFGAHDERGAANLVTAEVTRAALDEVKTGEVISLGLPLAHNAGPVAGMRLPMQHFMRRDGGDYAAGLRERGGLGFADDTIVVSTHGGTHLDALAHVWHDHTLYNGFSANTVTSQGAIRCGIDKVGPIVTRALIVDLVPEGKLGLEPEEAIGSDVIAAKLQGAGLAPRPGDALLIRTGWIDRWRKGEATVENCPGLDPRAASWIARQGFALVGADNLAVEVMPSPAGGGFLPLHIELIRDNGIYLLELLNMTALRGVGCRACLLMVSPLPIVNGVGSPVAPVVIL